MDKAIAMRFSENKEWHPALNTWYKFFKNHIKNCFWYFLFGGARSFWLTLYIEICDTHLFIESCTWPKIRLILIASFAMKWTACGDYCSDFVLWSIHHIAAIIFTLCLDLHEPDAAKHGAAIFGQRSTGEIWRDTATLNLIFRTRQDCKIIRFLFFNKSEKRLFDIIDSVSSNQSVSYNTQALGQSQQTNLSNPLRQTDRVA